YNKDIPLGAMIEIPSAVIMAEEFADHVDFFSIGTNDLIQYSMAIDRRNRKVAHLYQAMNPAVLKMIKMTFDAAQKKGIDLVMCGEMAGDPFNLPVLVGLGLRDLSMNSAAIPAVKKMIRELDTKQATRDAQKILKCVSVKQISDYIQNKYKAILPFSGTDE
ncbi:MAG: phosphoenolpyruvate--protein phosphotransferase, partial [Desulfobacteraceae bacterium]|nr:phosphoenolpyruvate--protein phosphotransferase [Desulfobacteraceae bacterium]